MGPFISVIIPCRNEEKFIAECLDSLILQDFPRENLEILVIDGMSEDRTKEIIKEYCQRYPFIKALDNPQKITPIGLNLGIKKSSGDIIIRMDAHTRYNKDYISKCVEYLDKSLADNVGGVTKTVSSSKGLVSQAVALCLNSFFGSGNSRFRTGVKKPMFVDTVFGGCYKREVFDKVGFFNEKLVRSQDIEFNLRLRKAGGKILLVPEIISYYYPKSNLKDFFWHNLEDGIWAVLPLKLSKAPLRLRHYIPLFFILGLFGSLLFSLFFKDFIWLFLLIIIAYFLLSFFFSLRISLKENNLLLLFLLPAVFFVRHLAYGLGSIIGLFKLMQK